MGRSVDTGLILTGGYESLYVVWRSVDCLLYSEGQQLIGPWLPTPPEARICLSHDGSQQIICFDCRITSSRVSRFDCKEKNGSSEWGTAI